MTNNDSSADPLDIGHEAFRASLLVPISKPYNPYKALAPPLPLPTGLWHRLPRFPRTPSGPNRLLKNSGEPNVFGPKRES